MLNNATGPAGGSRLYIDPETLFALQVPADWLIDTSGQQGTKVVLLSPTAEATFRANVNVSVQLLRGLTPEEFLTLSRLQLKQLTGRPRADRDEPAARPAGAHLLEWRTEVGPVSIQARQLIVTDSHKAYVVTAMAPATSELLYRRQFDLVFESFQLQPPPHVAPAGH
jgi:hypothetical protein